MRIGLIGLPRSGKTTVFNALTRSEAPIAAHANSRVEPNMAVVKVPDERVDRLSEIYIPRKTIYAKVELVDFAGLGEGAAKEGAFTSAAMAMIRHMDALALVVRHFQYDLLGNPTPLKDMDRINDELTLSDLMV
ncbi:MAG: 50S ribosome-binding GTPase, partial [Proteobacteria bacterium]|nr:50S ribosome-binding GTPase [Pseudomonadota bacterium]